MQMHYLPTNICNKIDRVMKNFIWGGIGSGIELSVVLLFPLRNLEASLVGKLDYLILLFLGS